MNRALCNTCVIVIPRGIPLRNTSFEGFWMVRERLVSLLTKLRQRAVQDST